MTKRMKFKRLIRWIASVTAIPAAFGAAPVWAQDGLTDMGVLNGGTLSESLAVSADGSMVVGYALDGVAGAVRAFRWTEAGGMVSLGTLNGGTDSEAHGVNADGSVVVGFGWDGVAGAVRAFRWTETGGMVSLGTLGGPSSYAYGVNSDGTVVVGHSDSDAWSYAPRAFRWTEAGGMVNLGVLSGGTSSLARGVSADGSVVAGTSNGLHSDGGGSDTDRAFRWTEASGMVSLGVLNGGYYSQAYGVSSDGNVVVGFAPDGAVLVGESGRAFRWTQADGMVSLGALTSGTSFAYGTNIDGSVVVGYSSSATGTRAFRWNQTTGMQTVEDWLRDNGVTVASDMTLYAHATNPEGNVVVGRLENNQAFIARVATTTGTGAGSGLITLADVSDSLNATAAVRHDLLTTVNTALNGIHSNPLSHRVAMGKKTLWLAGDWGRDDHGSRDGDIGLAELGGGYRLKNLQLNLSIGRTSSKQSMSFDGHVKTDGTYIMAEALVPLQGNEKENGLWLTLGGYGHKGDADIRRGYLNAGVSDASTANPDTETWGVKARIDWEKAATVGKASLSPYADLSYAKARLDAYTETGGGFPASFDAKNETSTEARLGVNSNLPLTETAKLLGTLEWAHRFEETGARTSGQLIGLFGFDLEGQRLNRDWLRVGAGVEGKLGYGMASVMVNATTKGEMPNVWLAASYQIAF